MSIASEPVIEPQRFDSNGLSIATDVGGPEDGQALIFLHGGGQTRQAWGKGVIEGAKRGFRVISADLRGHGESDWDPNADYNPVRMIEDVDAIVKTLHTPPVLVGASMGGLIALAYAGTRRPLKALVLVDIAPKMETKGVSRIGEFMHSAPNGFANIEEAADAVAAYLPHRPRPKDTSGLMKNLRLREDGRLHWHWDPRMLSEGKTLDMEILREAARQVTVPTLLVRGKQSDVLSLDGAADFLELVPHAEFSDIAGADHMVAGDKNDAFNDAVFDFLKRVS